MEPPRLSLASGDTTLAKLATINTQTSSTGVKADVVGTGANQQLRLTDSTVGGGSISVLSGTTIGALQASGLTIGQSGIGLASATAVQADAVNQINSAIENNSTLNAAGIQAS